MVYEPGITISSWPEARFARALALTNELENRINAWLVEKPLRATVHLSDDARRLEFRLQIVTKPPIQEISLLFGAIIHELRSSLDAVVYALAAVEAGKDRPENEGALMFPVVKEKAEWIGRGMPRINQLPDDAVAMIEAQQPFNAPEGKVSAFDAIHGLDIIDKHRRAITVEPADVRYLIRGLRFTLTEQTDMEPFDAGKTPALEDGELLGGFTFNKPIALGEQGTVTALPSWLVNVGIRGAEMTDVLRELTGATRSMLDQLYGHPVAPKFLEWVWDGPGEDPTAAES